MDYIAQPSSVALLKPATKASLKSGLEGVEKCNSNGFLLLRKCT